MPPLRATWVSGVWWKPGAETCAVCTPAASAREKTVGCGCQACGSVQGFQRSWFISSPLSGLSAVYPGRPCSPGVRPVPTEASEVAVVAGKPAVSGCPVPPREVAMSEERNGASAGWARSWCQPSPSMRKTQLRSAGGSSVRVAVMPGTPEPAASVGSRSASEPLP